MISDRTPDASRSKRTRRGLSQPTLAPWQSNRLPGLKPRGGHAAENMKLTRRQNAATRAAEKTAGILAASNNLRRPTPPLRIEFWRPYDEEALEADLVQAGSMTSRLPSSRML